MKRIVSIQDISCLGKCSLTVCLPVISAMGVECAILPTTVLSAHTVFSGISCLDLTDQITPISNHWKKEGLEFDAIYTGYLASKGQIDQVCQFIQDFRKTETLVFVDPAMADQGKLYTGFDEDFPQHMAKVCALGDVLVPNITEACLLTNTPYKTQYNREYIEELLEKLGKFGCHYVAITGVSYDEDTMGIVGLDCQKNTYFSYFPKRLPHHYHGTGDLFASCTVGALMRGMELKDAMALAADFVAVSIQATADAPDAKWYGVEFEKALPYLITRLMIND